MFGAGVWPTMLTSARAAPLLAEGALVACTIAWAHDAYPGNSIYDAAKACIARFAFAMAHDLRERRVTAVAIAPGFMRTERVLAAHAGDPFDLSVTESPEYLGGADRPPRGRPRRASTRTGELLTAGDLARSYGFTDVDGSQPEPFTIPRVRRRIAGTTTSQSRRASSWPDPSSDEQLGAGDLARQRFAVARGRTAGPRCRG